MIYLKCHIKKQQEWWITQNGLQYQLNYFLNNRNRCLKKKEKFSKKLGLMQVDKQIINCF